MKADTDPGRAELRRAYAISLTLTAEDEEAVGAAMLAMAKSEGHKPTPQRAFVQSSQPQPPWMIARRDEVWRLSEQGMTPAQIARATGLSVHTVANDLSVRER